MKDSSLSPSSRLGGAVISDRVVAALLQELRTGRYADADRLPAEVDLAAQLGVSRTVIRDALSEMERAGYIERVRGIGTVVNRTVLNLRSRLDQKLEYYPLIRSFGSYPHADGIQIYPTRAGEELARDLGIEAGDEVICIKKRILADTTPVIYSIDYLPRALFGSRDYTRIDLSGDIFEILERECHQQIASNVAHLKASCGDEAIRAAMRELMAKRKASQPLEYPSAGRTFKRPEGYYAGTLIQETGLKGLTVGGAQVSEKHAGFVINTGGATCADVMALIAQVQDRVMQRSGIHLEPEVRIIEN